jgi:SNF2 family DNA or RNA helicase
MLAVCMGGGKSRITLELTARNRLSPVLILCPLRVVEVWREQFLCHLPGQYEFLALDDQAGSVQDKTCAARDLLAWCSAKGRPLAIAINYESAMHEPFAHWSLANLWPLVVADEGHRLKQPGGSLSRFVGRLGLRARYRLGLTGTPMPHSPLDVWAQFRFIDRTVYDPTFASFKRRYAKMGGYYDKEIVDWQNLDELREKFFSRAFQVGSEVLDLPGEHDQTLYCALAPAGARLYADLEKEFVAWIENTPAVVVAANALVRLLRLQQTTGGTVTDSQGEERLVDTSKRELLEDLLEDLPAAEPVVVFARFKSDLAAIHRAAKTLERASGELSGSRDDLAAWKRGRPGDPVILAVQIQAGGVGIDLTRACYGVYYSTGFNLAEYQQSRARLYRSGQTRPCWFYHLAVRHSVDESIARALARRHELVSGVLQPDLVRSVLEEMTCSQRT